MDQMFAIRMVVEEYLEKDERLYSLDGLRDSI